MLQEDFYVFLRSILSQLRRFEKSHPNPKPGQGEKDAPTIFYRSKILKFALEIFYCSIQIAQYLIYWYATAIQQLKIAGSNPVTSNFFVYQRVLNISPYLLSQKTDFLIFQRIFDEKGTVF